MPVKRRASKAISKHPPLVQMLLDGQPIDRTDANREEVIAAFYFGWSDDLPHAAIDAAGAQLDIWRADDEGHAGG